jgi:hypothetical protein
MRLEITRNFISIEECKILNAWVDEGVDRGWLANGITAGGVGTNKRFTTRFYGHRFEYPQEIMGIAEKIKIFVGVSSYPIIKGHGRNGIVVSYTLPQGDVYKHQDPKFLGLSALRCNIMTQAADEGGKLFVDNNKVDIGVGDLHCYLASDYEHYVTEVKGNTPRILWMFGAYVPKNSWENGEIQYGLS